MIRRIKEVIPTDNFILDILFDDGERVFYDVKEDIEQLPNYNLLKDIYGLFFQAKLDESRTYVYWNDEIDLPSDILYEYGIHEK